MTSPAAAITPASSASASSATSRMLDPGRMSWNSLRSSTLPEGLERGRQLPARERGQATEHLGGHEVALGAAVRALRASLGGQRPAMELEIELADPGRSAALGHAALRPGEELVDAAEALGGHGREGGQLARPLDHLPRRPAAAVAVADREQALRVDLPAAVVAPGRAGGHRPDDAVVAAVGVVEEVGQHARAVQSLPPEQVVREAVGLRPVQLDREEVLDPGAEQELRQGGGEAEAVGQPADRVLGAEARAERPLPVEELTHERLTGGHHAVGLHPHPADRLQAALGDELAHAREQLRIVFLQERVDLRGGLVEGQLGVGVQELDRGRERAPGLAARLGQGPAPRQVEVGVAGEQERPDGWEALAQLGQPGVEHAVGREDRGALVALQRGRVGVEVARQLPHVLHLARVPAPRDVGGGRAREHERPHGALADADDGRRRLVRAELARGERDQLQPPDQALELEIDPREAGAREPRVGVGRAEREPRDDLDLDRERRRADRERLVLLVERQRSPRAVRALEGQQALATEVELEPRLPVRPAGGGAQLGMREAPHAVAGRPGRAEPERRAVEAPVIELHPGAHPPRAQLVGALRQ